MVDLGSGNKILRLRAPLKKQIWAGNWNPDDPKWTPETLRRVNENWNYKDDSRVEDDNPLVVESDDNDFWMSYEDVLQHFEILDVCKTQEMEEIRIRGKFLRIQDVEDVSNELVVSKWFYRMNLIQQTKICVGLH